METVAEHPFEAAIAAPPPRDARLPLSTSLLLLVAVLLFTLFISFGLRALGEAAKLAWLEIGGRTVAARVTKIEMQTPRVKGETARQTGVRYEWTKPGERGTNLGYAHLYDPDEAGDGGFAGARPARPRIAPTPFKVGDTLPLRVASWPGGKPLTHPWSPPPTGKFVFLTLSGSLVIGVSLLLLRRIARWRRSRLHLLRHGLAAIGTIIHKHANTDDSLRYFLRYGFAAQDGETREIEEQCGADEWRIFQIGQSVTVLYDPARPDDASLYALIGKK